MRLRRKKTYKREVAVACTLALFAIGIHANWSADPDLIRARMELVRALALPVFAFLTAAYGLDWYSGQMMPEQAAERAGGPPVAATLPGDREMTDVSLD